MNISELIGFAAWVENEVKQPQIQAAYSALESILSSNAQQSQPQRPFETERDKLLEKLRAVPLHSLTVEQTRLLENLGLAEHLGKEAADAVEDVLFRNVIDSATAASKLKEAARAVGAGVQRSDAIRAALADLVEPDEELEAGVLVRVEFAGEASIENVVDLKEWTAKWYDIARGLALAHDERPEDVLVVGAGTGSILVELAVTCVIAKTMMDIIIKALEAAERILTIRLQADKLRKLKLEEVASQVQEEADLAKEEAVVTIIAEVRQELPGEIDGEQANALSKSVKELLDFLDKGGEVDCLVPEEEELEGEEDEDAATVETIRTLRASVFEMRVLEERIKLLGSDEEHS